MKTPEDRGVNCYSFPPITVNGCKRHSLEWLQENDSSIFAHGISPPPPAFSGASEQKKVLTLCIFRSSAQIVSALFRVDGEAAAVREIKALKGRPVSELATI